MAIDHRKFLLDKKPEDGKKYASPCHMCYYCPDNCTVSLSPPPPLAHEKYQMSTILIFMLCILGAASLFLAYFTIGRYRNARRRDSPSLANEDFVDENQGPILDHPIWYIRTVGFPQSVIDSIAVFKYRKDEGLIDKSDCSVCLNEFQEDESLRLLPKCSHAFHVPCIDTWLRSHMNCPVCRAPIMISNMNNSQVNSVEMTTRDSGSGSSEENRTENELETRLEFEDETREMPENSSGNPVEDHKMTDMLFKNRVLSDLADHRVKVDQELQQPTRRSVSMDFSSASMIYQSINKLEIVEKQNPIMIGKRGSRNSSSIYRLIKSSSCGRSIQKGPVLMKRSFSFSGKRSMRKHSRSQEAIPIPELSTQN